jgi:D-arabinose 1-dehydrogenase-like Zn-dependent alcohol dehydrogenase
MNQMNAMMLERIHDLNRTDAPLVPRVVPIPTPGERDALLRLDYSSHLWHEKEIKSVANVARSDVPRFLELADRVPIIPEVEVFRLDSANRALMALKGRKIRGAKVLLVEHR